jgi:alpha-beta hydrolase superfamily lysophospholipase
VAAAAPATDLARLLELDAGSLTGNGLTSLAVVSWSQVYPAAPLTSILEPAAIPLAHGVADHCISDVLSDLPLVAAEKLTFTKEDPATIEPWATYLRQNSVGPDPIPAPMMIVQGTADSIVRPEVTADFIGQRCRAGESLQYLSVDGAGHIGVQFASAAAVVLWTRDRFDHAFVANGCDGVPK